jgi:hypothetical protein
VGPVIATMNLRPEHFRGDHLWMITAIAGSSLRCCSARGQHPARRTVTRVNARLRAPHSGERLRDLGLSTLPLPELLDHDVK